MCCGLDTHPLLLQDIEDPPESKSSKHDVLQIVLKQFPISSDDVSWEEILEFRADAESREKFLRLRNWMSDVARMAFPQNELQEKLEGLIIDYQNHMRTHKIKTVLDTLKTMVIAEAGLVTSGWLTGFRVIAGLAGVVVTPYFTIRQAQVALMEQEQKAAGREVAYIEAARTSLTHA